SRHWRENGGAYCRVPPEKRTLQKDRGVDERPRHRRKEFSEAQRTADGRDGQERSQSATAVIMGVQARPRQRRGRAAASVHTRWCIETTQTRRSLGHSLVELTVVLSLMTTIGAVAAPTLLAALDDQRTAGAAR